MRRINRSNSIIEHWFNRGNRAYDQSECVYRECWWKMKIFHGTAGSARAKDGRERAPPFFARARERCNALARNLERSGLTTSVNARSGNVSLTGKEPLNLAGVSFCLVIVIMLSRVITHNGGISESSARASATRLVPSRLVASHNVSSRLLRISKPVDPVLFTRRLPSLHCINYRIIGAIDAMTFWRYRGAAA